MSTSQMSLKSDLSSARYLPVNQILVLQANLQSFFSQETSLSAVAHISDIEVFCSFLPHNLKTTYKSLDH